MANPAPHSSPALHQAVEYLQKMAHDPAWQARGELPGVRALARLSGLSHFTLWKALRHAAQSGWLIVEPGRRPRLPGASPRPAPVGTGLRKWERLRVALEGDLLRGEFPGDEPPPTLKEMQAKYHVCYTTLRKVLRDLEKSGRWPPSPFPGGAAKGRRNVHRVVYLAWGDRKGNQYFENPFDHVYLESFREACHRLNLEPVTVVYTYVEGRPRLLPAPGQPPFEKLAPEAIGFLLRTACPRDVCADLLPGLAGFGKPVAVLDELGSESLPELAGRHPRVKAFRPTISETSGELMALHLLSMGHRRLALFSPFSSAVWSRNRLAGLERTLSRADSASLAVEFTPDLAYQLPHDVREAVAHRILKQALLQSRPKWKGGLPSLAGVVGRLEPEIHFAARRERILEALEPGLEEALRRKDLTAWVAVDDDTALLLLDFLNRRGLRVPETVSLVGFDDTAEGARRDLTSFNFDFSRFNHYALRYLLEPAQVEKAERRGTRMPQGRVVPRGSVRRRPP